jgi:hypothetical protein
MSRRGAVPAWETLLAHAATLQTKVPGAVLVGGTAAALHAKHRYSLDHDHVVKNLADNYDAAMRALESIAGWSTERRVRGKMVLGKVEGIAAGVRNQRRMSPLETVELRTSSGKRLRIPTVPEMLRVKSFLALERNATRDYSAVVALSSHLGLNKSAAALESMNRLYADFAGEGGDILTSLVVSLVQPQPYDLTEVDLSEYRGIIRPWNSWRSVAKQCADLAAAILKAEP